MRMKILRNLNLKYKILIGVISISTVCLVLISVTCYKYLADTYEEDTIDNAHYALGVGASNLREDLENIILNANKFISTSKVSSIIESFSNQSNIKEYVERYNNIQSPLQNYIRTNQMIDTIVLIGKNGEFYGISDMGWNHGEDLFDNVFRDTQGIMLLPVQKNPLTKLNNVVPMVMPVTTLDGGERPVISGSVEEATGNLIIYLNAKKISNSITKMNKSPESIIYIADENGIPMNLEVEAKIYKTVDTSAFKDKINSMEDSVQFTYNMDGDNYIAMAKEVGICNLKLVSITSKNQLLNRLDTIKGFILSIWGLSTLLSIVLSLVLSEFITRKIGKLTKDVQNIEKGFYEIEDSDTTDEVGRLRDSINSMYLTIQKQIMQIKKEEKERTKAEINILSEQINPHFLYNTLDCINWEILSGEKETASNMITSLSDFLRIGLSHGASTVAFESEVSHVTNYLYIMNQRSNYQIKFVSQLDETLKDYPIVRLILQPLVENCIKHGFAQIDLVGMGITPTIEIEIKQIDSEVVIAISDNGAGIDIESARKSLLYFEPENKRKQVGLYNIYQRLRSFYGEEIKFDFYSTPFYKNTIKITLPLKSDSIH